MKKSSAILIIETFSNKELKLFENFLNSPFHNRNTKVIRLFKKIKKYYPDYPQDKISKENLFKEILGNAKYSELYIRNLLSDLNILAEKFLKYIHIPDEYSYEKFLIEELYNRNLQKLVSKKINLFEKKINSIKLKDQNYYINTVFINSMKGLSISDKSLFDKFSQNAISDNIKLFLITVLESYFQLIIEEQRINITHNFDYLKHTLNYLNSHLADFNDSPFLLIYYNLWLAFLDEDGEKSFLKARKIFRTNFKSFTQMDRKNVYAVMQTFCLKKTETGVEHYNKVLLDIMIEMLKNNVTSHRKDIINLNLYRNILIMCFKLNETVMMKKFISGYIGFVSPESRTSMLAYSNAHLNFLQGHFGKTLEFCNKINFKKLLITTNENLYFKNDVKSLTLKCLYELNFHESALSHIDTYRHFLNNSKLIKETSKKKHMLFIKAVYELLKLKSNFNDYELHKLKKNVAGTKNLIGKEWVMEKLNEIKR